jgi:protein-tyrosine phosphatase
MVKILFVCMGNICRSPTAEGVFKHLLAQTHLQVFVDSAGTHSYHVGEPPDKRSQAAAAERGIDISTLRSRLITQEDFEKFDYILAMDKHNHGWLKRICPQKHLHKLQLFLEFAPHLMLENVPDPYYGDKADFEEVLDLVEEASQGLLAHLRQSINVRDM